MIPTIVLGIFAVSFAFLAKYKNLRYGLEISFFLIFLFLALRYNFGNDYMEYSRNFDAIKSTVFSRYELFKFSEDKRLEIGFVYLIKLFPFTNFFVFVAIWSLVNCIVYYYIIKKYVSQNYYWFALAIYLLCPLGMLIQSSAFRQTIAIWMFVWAFKYLKNQNLIKYLIVMTIGGLIHKSCFILIPLYFLGNVKLLKDKLIYVFSAIFILLLFINFTVKENILPFVDQYFNRYLWYAMNNNNELLREQTLVEILVKAFLLVLILYSFRVGNLLQRKYSVLAAFFVLFFSLVNVVFLLDRISMYFIPFLIITLPNAMVYIKNVLVRYASIGLIVSYYLVQFIRIFYSETWSEHFIIYQTIFGN